MDDSSSSQDHTTTSQMDANSSMDQCKFEYNPVHYDRYELPPSDWTNQLTVDSLNGCNRNDQHPTVQFDHFFRAAISSSLKPTPERQNKDTSYLRYLDADFDDNTKAFYENEISGAKSRHARPKPKFYQMCSEIDGVTVEAPEVPEIRIVEEDEAKIETVAVPTVIGDDDHIHKGRFSITNLDSEKDSLLLLKPSTVDSQFRKKFSIASLFTSTSALNNNNQLMDAKRKTQDHVQSFTQIMESCLELEHNRSKEAATIEKKTVRFDTSYDEQTINHINQKLIAEGLPDLQSCIATQKEVSRRNKERQIVREKISGLLLTFIVIGVLLALGVFLAFRLLDQLQGFESEPEEFIVVAKQILAEKQEAFVKVDCFTYIGSKHGDVISFRGIPYVDQFKRWKKHSKNTCSDSNQKKIINATEYGNVCMQMANDTVIGSEDCLFLNIWTRSRSFNSRQPVVVFIHDGNFLTGSGDMGSKYDLYNFIAEKVVLVSFNYRLNIFGWFVTGSQANFGFDDQIVALSWIQENIQYFGGDPDRVTLLGEQTGALSVLALALSERSSGLFQSIWISHIPDRALEFKTINFTAAKYTYRNHFFEEFDCTNYNCLRALDAKLLSRSYKAFINSHNLDLESNFVIDSSLFNQATERFFSDVTHTSSSYSRPSFLLSNISIVFGTSLMRPFSKNSTSNRHVCNLFRLFSRISAQPQVSLYHYNIEFNETLFKQEGEEGLSIDISAILDRYEKFEKYGETAIEFQKIIRSQFLYLINGNRKNFKWEKFQNESIVFNPSSIKVNHFFSDACKMEKKGRK